MKKETNSWFEVDKEGLGKLTNRLGHRSFIIYELVQNAWDEASKNVDIKFEYVSNLNGANIKVKDDNPDGFKDLVHAYKLFAESDKKSDPGKRGRFNFGEKLVLACCSTAGISTTKGTIYFQPKGIREEDLTIKTKKGSIFSAFIKMTRTEFENILKDAKKLIPQHGIKTTLNGDSLGFATYRKHLNTFMVALPTEVADEFGKLRPTERLTKVDVYEPVGKPTIYEMGIPVVVISDRYDIDISQKVPLNLDRNNVTPGYLRKLRVVVLNHMLDKLTEDDITESWVQEASSQKSCSKDAITKVADLKFGEKRVSYDPSDPEANKLAMSEGYTVVAGRTFSKGQWYNLRKADAIKPAGQVTPSPKPYSPDGDLLKFIPQDKWTNGMKKVEALAKMIANVVMDIQIKVKITNDPNLNFAATFGPGGPLVLSKRKLGAKFFDEFPDNMIEVLSLLIHEFGHQYSGDHLSSEYHRALCNIGAKIVSIALMSKSLKITEFCKYK